MKESGCEILENMPSGDVEVTFARVHVEIDHADVEGDYGQVEGLCLVCARCGHEVEVAGTTGASARRGAALLREECPKGESNFYDVEYWE